MIAFCGRNGDYGDAYDCHQGDDLEMEMVKMETMGMEIIAIKVWRCR